MVILLAPSELDSPYLGAAAGFNVSFLTGIMLIRVMSVMKTVSDIGNVAISVAQSAQTQYLTLARSWRDFSDADGIEFANGNARWLNPEGNWIWLAR